MKTVQRFVYCYQEWIWGWNVSPLLIIELGYEDSKLIFWSDARLSVMGESDYTENEVYSARPPATRVSTQKLLYSKPRSQYGFHVWYTIISLLSKSLNYVLISMYGWFPCWLLLTSSFIKYSHQSFMPIQCSLITKAAQNQLWKYLS